jgi:exopolysaccharide biosynthesis polyprenyl glycosylphosphotransferase
VKKIMNKIQSASALLLTLFVLAVVGTTSWATMTMIQEHNDIPFIQEESIPQETTTSAQEKGRTQAPEPSTMALFGSGLFGMLISVVRRTYTFAKRIFDVVVSILAIIFLSPLFLFAAILIKCSSKGPVFFTQTRVGKDGKHFEIFKFRTMRVDAEKTTGPVWAAQNDPRLIPVGKFLRKSHIDEIPQFINVIRGEMSIIGPRPERPLFVDQFKRQIMDYERRLEVKPGITGLAQVWHRYDETIEDVRKKIKYDLLYIRRLCLWTDLSILLRTVRVVFTGEGAR